MQQCNEFGNASSLLYKIRQGKISLADAKNDQAELKLNLSEIKKGQQITQIKRPKNALNNIEMLYRARNKVIEFFDDYSLIVSEVKLKATKGTRFKILTPKQML